MKRIIFAALLLGSTSFAQLSAVDTLVAAERAFAKRSRDTNIRDAFLAFFAVDGIVFNPGPTNALQLYSKRSQLPFVLDWEPVYADVSQFGDMGFTTGPYKLTNPKNAVVDHGSFFSVWARQKDKTWKVMLDFGVPTSATHDLHAQRLVKGTPSAFHTAVSTSANTQGRILMASEGSLSNGKVYEQSLSAGAFVVQDGLQPLATEAARRKHLANMKTVKTWKPMGGGVAKNGDLAYTYGAYQVSVAGSLTNEVRTGYYARVWKRDNLGQWKIALDNTQALR